MALPVEEIKKYILDAIPDASIEIKDLMGDNNHYSAIIKSKIFKGMNKIEQHQAQCQAHHALKPWPIETITAAETSQQ